MTQGARPELVQSGSLWLVALPWEACGWRISEGGGRAGREEEEFSLVWGG